MWAVRLTWAWENASSMAHQPASICPLRPPPFPATASVCETAEREIGRAGPKALVSETKVIDVPFYADAPPFFGLSGSTKMPNRARPAFWMGRGGWPSRPICSTFAPLSPSPGTVAPELPYGFMPCTKRALCSPFGGAIYSFLA